VVPQLPQNFAVAGSSALQTGHFILQSLLSIFRAFCCAAYAKFCLMLPKRRRRAGTVLAIQPSAMAFQDSCCRARNQSPACFLCALSVMIKDDRDLRQAQLRIIVKPQ
jgi:hypothetical protein